MQIFILYVVGWDRPPHVGIMVYVVNVNVTKIDNWTIPGARLSLESI